VLKQVNSEISPEEKKRILKERARALAKEEKVISGKGFLNVVEFILAGETFAIELKYASEVYPLKDFTSLPGIPPFIRGITNVRGKIISIVDLKDFFEIPDQGGTDSEHLIILQSKDMEFGILADEILGIKTIPMDCVQPSLPTLTGIRGEYLKGVTGERLVILDGKKILLDEKIIVQ